MLVEDSDNWLKIFHTTVGKKTVGLFDYHHVGTMKDALGALKKDQFDIIIFDLMLPDSVAADTVKVIAEVAESTPVVVMTTLDDEKLMQQAFVNGVEDYLVKDQYEVGTFVHTCRQSIRRFLARKEREVAQKGVELSAEIEKIITNLISLNLKLDQWLELPANFTRNLDDKQENS